MITEAIRRRQQELTERREPFVTATVVKTEKPTSAVPGDVALVPADGVLEGFVGGICAQNSVRLYALQALARGEPLLLRIMPDDSDEAGADPEAAPLSDGHVIASGPGSVTVRNSCLSGGSIEIFLEPTVPAPRVLVAGDSPITAALAQIGPSVGFEIVVRAGRTDPLEFSEDDLALIVVGHGRDEIEPLVAGLEAGVPYIGLVASRKRGQAVLEQLVEAGADPSATARIETPAGLDIGARHAGEIAVSLLARVVEVRRDVEAFGAGAGSVFPAPADDSAAPPESGRVPRTAVDPICGMTVVVDDETPRSERDGEAVYFCCEGCKRAFDQGP